MRTRRVVFVLGLSVVCIALLGGALFMTPARPTAETAASVATRLEAVLPVLDELGVNLWRDGYVAGCRHLSLDDGKRYQDPAGSCGDAAPFDSASSDTWNRVADAVAGVALAGRVQSVLIVDRTVTFIVVPRTILGLDAPLMRWVWTWRQGAETDPGLPSFWQFKAANAAVV